MEYLRLEYEKALELELEKLQDLIGVVDVKVLEDLFTEGRLDKRKVEGVVILKIMVAIHRSGSTISIRKLARLIGRAKSTLCGMFSYLVAEGFIEKWVLDELTGAAVVGRGRYLKASGEKELAENSGLSFLMES